jgi:hypothetical protein
MSSRPEDVPEVPTGRDSARRRSMWLDFAAYFVVPLLIIVGLPLWPGAGTLWALLLAVPALRALLFALAWFSGRQGVP